MDVDVDGRRIAFRQSGSGPPLVLLHGGLCDGRVWRPVLDELGTRFTVIAWDTPGCGASPDAPETFRLPDYARCLAGLIDTLELARPHILGHSWGAGLAIELYRQRPDIPATLLLAGGYAGWAGSLPAEEVAQRLRVALELADSPPEAIDPTSVPGLFSAVMAEDRAVELAAIMSQVRPAATRSMAHAFAEADLREVLPTIEVPTLLLHGDADERSPVDPVGADLHRAIPGSRLVVLPGLGHEAYLEAPEEFSKAVFDFVGDAA